MSRNLYSPLMLCQEINKELNVEIKKLKEQLEQEFVRGVDFEKKRIENELEKLKNHNLPMYAFVITLIK